MTAAGEEPRVGTEEARATFADLLRRAGQDRASTVITHRDYPVARVVPYTDQPPIPHADFQALVNACIRAGWKEGPVVEMFGEFVDQHGFDMTTEATG
jgi:prevent-host-death family protein